MVDKNNAEYRAEMQKKIDAMSSAKRHNLCLAFILKNSRDFLDRLPTLEGLRNA